MFISIYCTRVGPVSGLISHSYSLHCVERILVKGRNVLVICDFRYSPVCALSIKNSQNFLIKCLNMKIIHPIQFLHFQASIPVFLQVEPIFIEKKISFNFIDTPKFIFFYNFAFLQIFSTIRSNIKTLIKQLSNFVLNHFFDLL